jgi:DNA-binding transcriptional regulator YhcF (GntR family)
MPPATAAQQRQEGLRTNDQKWSPLLMDSGWMALPNVVVENQRALGLDAVDINILLHLIRHWWQPDNLPHPSKRTIAECMSIDQSTVRRHLAKMERNGLISRVARYDKTLGQKTNAYEFSGLIEQCRAFAVETLKLREAKREEASRRRIRGRPRIVRAD